jgi:SAM-dependent methyltransferase
VTLRKRVVYTIADRGSALGSRLGWPWLVYNPAVYQLFHDVSLEQGPLLAAAIRDQFPELRRVLDVGCGTGTFARELGDLGVAVSGCEMSAQARRYAKSQGVTAYPFRLEPHISQVLIGSPYDMATCFEVAEHVPAELADRLVEYLVAAAPVVVLTPGHPGQGGHGHINEQPQSYWISRFEKAGHFYDRRASEVARSLWQERGIGSWLCENVMVVADKGIRLIPPEV